MSARSATPNGSVFPSAPAVALQYAAAEALWQGRFDEARRLARSLEWLIPGGLSFPAAARDQRMTARIKTDEEANWFAIWSPSSPRIRALPTRAPYSRCCGPSQATCPARARPSRC